MIEAVYDVLTAFDSFLSVMLIAVYLLSSYFDCALPCPSFTIISPEVILDYGMRNGYILFDMKQLFYFKTA